MWVVHPLQYFKQHLMRIEVPFFMGRHLIILLGVMDDILSFVDKHSFWAPQILAGLDLDWTGLIPIRVTHIPKNHLTLTLKSPQAPVRFRWSMRWVLYCVIYIYKPIWALVWYVICLEMFPKSLVSTSVGQVCRSWPGINQGIKTSIICPDQQTMNGQQKRRSYILPRQALLLLYTCNSLT